MQTVINNRITDFNKIKQASVQSSPVYLCHPWMGVIDDGFAQQISQTVQRCYFSALVRVVFKTKHILAFIPKVALPTHHNISFNYLFRCTCGSRNIERT